MAIAVAEILLDKSPSAVSVKIYVQQNGRPGQGRPYFKLKWSMT